MVIDHCLKPRRKFSQAVRFADNGLLTELLPEDLEIGISTGEQDRHFGLQLARALRQLDARHRRHGNVRKHDGELLARELLKRLLPRWSYSHIATDILSMAAHTSRTASSSSTSSTRSRSLRGGLAGPASELITTASVRGR